MTCGKCEDAVKAELMKCNEVNDARVSHKDGKAIVNINVFEFGVDEIILAKRSSQISQGRKKWGRCYTSPISSIC